MLKRKFLVSSLVFVILALIPASVALWQAGAQENQLVFDEPVTGTLAIDDRDQWQFEAFTGVIVAITVEVTEGNLLPEISIFDATGALQAQIQGSEQDQISELTFRLSRVGEYRIGVEAINNTSGTYILTLALVESTEIRIEKGTLQ